MVRFDEFLKLMKRAHNNRDFNKETLRFLKEIWVEMNQVIVEIQPETETTDILFSEVDQDEIFYMAGERWCKISQERYVHMKNRKTYEISGDPVVTTTYKKPADQ
jgi:hypothetical protein